MISGLTNGIFDYLRGAKYLFSPAIIKYLIVSGIISLVLFALLFYGIYALGDNLGVSLLALLPFESLPNFLTVGIEWITRILLWILTALVFRYLVILITIPFMGPVSEIVEQKETNTLEDINYSSLGTMARGLRLAIANISKELSLTIILLIIGLIPGMALVTTPLIFILQAYFAGVGNMDCLLERRFGIKDTKRFVRRNKSLAIGNGSIFLAMLLVPVIGVFLAPTWSTIAATLSGLKATQNTVA